jgi:general secretion pathway protein K
MRARPLRRRARQRGVAVITALLLTTLAISIVASLFWQQQVQVRSMENQRLQLQTQWILRGALDWAKLVLRQDAIDNRWTSLDQVWATPLAETRLDQYIERERVAGENFNATLSGSVTDATSRYNLSNLASGGQPDKIQLAVYARLLTNLQLNPSLALTTAKFIAATQAPVQVPANPGGTGGQGGQGDNSGGQGDNSGTPAQGQTQAVQASAVMKLVRLDDLLAVPGYTPAMIEKLRPFAIVLPASGTRVNVNTAPAEVLGALVENYSVSQANSLVAQRKSAPFRELSFFATQVNAPDPTVIEAVADVKSDWFLVDSHIKLDRATLNVEALVSRAATIGPSIIRGPEVKWIRQI